ncbi:MAG: SMP-30/gluconolactonase/LRE family protein [Dehalococcoidia bacterium]|nr:SMP-30/gluconolactonase/LRE family protein [Dehalococcoidia bacterium]MSQ17958.1 SMP-30/gluconolactonase/LRE family protein [Dehalococcoidia bacterium]
MPIEKVAPGLDHIVSTRQQIKELGKGFGGQAGPAEGPLWWAEDSCLLFSDIGNNRRMKWSAQGGITLVKEPTNFANGLTRDAQGRLLACEHGTRRVTRQEPDGSITVVANSYRGRRLNRPNDVVCKSDGSIYFSDPGYPTPGLDLDYNGVYQVTPDLATITLISWDFTRPNGLAFSPDEKFLYINDTRRRHIRAFELEPNGMPLLATDRVFCDLNGERPGNPDGMKVDVEGNVYCGGAGGIWVMDSLGSHLGTIVHGAPATTNMAFGGANWQTLFFTTRNTLGSIDLNIPGMPAPAKKR